MAPKILFIAGDPSGDVHAAHVVRRLREMDGETECFGVGGPAMVAAGLEQVLPFEPFNCMGFLEVVRSLPFIFRAKGVLTRLMKQRKPSVVVLVDYAGFNIPMMKVARGLGIPVVWYIAPKVWAWKEHRAEVLGTHATAIATIFPFEVDLFKDYPARVEFVGNPLVEALDETSPEPEPLEVAKPQTFYRLAIVPGSRRQEVKSMLPPMIAAYLLLRRSYRQMRAYVSTVDWLPDKVYAQTLESPGVETFDGPLNELLEQSDAALVTSGTATLETALRGIPHVIGYKTSDLSYRIFRSQIKTPYIGLPNIIANESIVPECIQDEATGPGMAAALEQIIGKREPREEATERLRALRGELGSLRPSEEVARMICEAARG